MSGWTNTNKAYLQGTITSSLYLDSANGAGGSMPTGTVTYNDGTYDDFNYGITAYFNAQHVFDTQFQEIKFSNTADMTDIYYSIAESSDGISYSSFTAQAPLPSSIKSRFQYIDLKLYWYSPLWSDVDAIGATVSSFFVPFVKGTTISSAEMNNNFLHIGRGNFLPLGNNNLEPTTSIYDLGSDSYKFNTIYANNIYVNSVQSSYVFTKISETYLTAAASSIEITGLNGDSDSLMLINISINNKEGSSNEIDMIFNGDSSGSYGFQIFDDGVGARFSGVNYIIIDQITSDSGTSSYSNILIYAKTGQQRKIIKYGDKMVLSPPSEVNLHIFGIWSNTSDTITSIKFYNSAAATIQEDSIIQIFAAR